MNAKRITFPNGRGDLIAARLELPELEKELNRKDKALAETAALLVLQKKFQALWEGPRSKGRPPGAPRID